jgi:hypothetical protein
MQRERQQDFLKRKTGPALGRIIFVLAGTAILLSGCAFKFGEVDAVKEAEKLAIACRTEKALATLDRATQGGGLAGGIADLMRVTILRDAGRMAEADAAMAERNERWEADAENIAESEKAVSESMEELRAERQKQTGRRTCN